VFSSFFPNFVDSLSESFAGFPLPQFLGLQLEVTEIARIGNYFTLFSNLVEIPTTHMENVVVFDTSDDDQAMDSPVLNSWEWRHKLRKKISSNRIDVNLDGMVGADACCIVSDSSMSANTGYRVYFEVATAPGDSWRVDLSHLIRGAHTANNEGDGGARTTISTVNGRYRRNGGAWTNFNFNPSDTGGNSGSGFYEPFTGSSATSFTGSSSVAVEIEFFFNVSAVSDSGTFSTGDESAIRFGANDSLANFFSVGDYPGVGGRNITQDGHFGTITLTT
jgi:hypothetical protein